MLEVARFSSLVSTLYDGLADDAAWHASMQGIVTSFELHFSVVGLVDRQTGDFVSSQFYGIKNSRMLAAQRDYEEHQYRIDPTVAALRSNPCLAFCDSAIHPAWQTEVGKSYTRFNHSEFGSSRWGTALAAVGDRYTFGI